MNKLDYCKEKRYQKTILFLKKHMPPPCKVLDLGTPNDFSEIMKTLAGARFQSQIRLRHVSRVCAHRLHF